MLTMARADSRVRVAGGLVPLLDQGLLPHPVGLHGGIEVADPRADEITAPSGGEPGHLHVGEAEAEDLVDAGRDVPGISGESVADALDVFQVALGLVGDEVAHPHRQVLAAHLQGQGTRMAGDHPLVVQ